MNKSSNLYYARTGSIKAYDYSEFEIELGFRIKITVGLRLLLGIPKIKEEHLKDRAKRCVIALLGGRKVILEVLPDETIASVYPFRKALLDYNIEIGGESVIDVSKVMQEMYNNKFDMNFFYKNVLNSKEGE